MPLYNSFPECWHHRMKFTISKGISLCLNLHSGLCLCHSRALPPARTRYSGRVYAIPEHPHTGSPSRRRFELQRPALPTLWQPPRALLLVARRASGVAARAGRAWDGIAQ
eukprot:6209277-Pleurochrysis_carterae.AAC.1